MTCAIRTGFENSVERLFLVLILCLVLDFLGIFEEQDEDEKEDETNAGLSNTL